MKGSGTRQKGTIKRKKSEKVKQKISDGLDNKE